MNYSFGKEAELPYWSVSDRILNFVRGWTGWLSIEKWTSEDTLKRSFLSAITALGGGSKNSISVASLSRIQSLSMSP